VVDGRISDKAYRVLDLIRCLAWSVPVVLAYDEIASAVKSSRPQVILHVKALEKFKYIAVTRFGNRCNEYSVPGVTGVRIAKQPAAKQSESKPAPELVRCPKCHGKCRQLLKVGWCRSCGWKHRVRGIAREEIAASMRGVA